MHTLKQRAKCYGCVLNDHAHTDAKMVDICGGLIDWGEKGFQPAMHINYANAMFKIKDGKPKFKNFPKAFGGETFGGETFGGETFGGETNAFSDQPKF